MTTQDKVAGGATAQKEVFYSPASELLINARKEIAAYSFARAQQRLLATKRIREDEALEAAETVAVRDLYLNSKDVTLNASQVGDDRPITTVRYSPDGKLVCSGSLSGVVKVWDTETLEVRAVLRGTLDRITSISWHPQAQLDSSGPMLLAAASAEGCCHVYDFHKYDAAAAAAAMAPAGNNNSYNNNNGAMECDGDSDSSSDDDDEEGGGGGVNDEDEDNDMAVWMKRSPPLPL